MCKFAEALRRNPERLSIVERDRQEAIRVAHFTNRTIVDDKGNVIPSKRFVDGYVKMLEQL